MKILLHVDKSVEENAAIYFDKSKKLRKKLEGAKKALQEHKKKLAQLEKKRDKELEKKQEEQRLRSRKKEWYEKFRWFFTSEDFLVLGGRDATSNEIVIKKHTEKGDFVFHTDMAGSPFFVLKAEGKKPGKKSINEVADATCTFSKAWKNGLSTTPVFYVNPDQVSKKAKAGEYLQKGAFMIYGETTYVDNEANLAVGITKEGAIMAGPLSAIKKHCVKSVPLSQGDEKTSNIAKKLQRKLEGGTLDEIIRVLPAGGCKVRK